MTYQKRYETLRIDDSETIGPLQIPIIPPGVNPDQILPFIIEQIKKQREEQEKPRSPFISYDQPKLYH